MSKPATRQMDPVQTEIMKNRFAAIVEEGSTIVIRTAYTTFVKQTQDFQCALANADGEICAHPYMTGVTTFIGIHLGATIDSIGRDNLRDGDIIITNDPFGSDGMCTHIMDVHLIKPIFRGGKIIAFAWSFLHASDVGGAVPGSISPTLHEVFQEGIRLRPVKLYKAGELNEDVLHIFQDNCRIPEEVWGDLQALIAAMKTMERRVTDLCTRLGDEVVVQAMSDVIALAEIRGRTALKKLKNGVYHFSDYLEGVNSTDLSFLTLEMTVNDGAIKLDFTGSDPQVKAALNFITGDRTHPFLTQAINYYILTEAPNTPMNAGLTYPITTVAPRGTLMNANFPAAMGNRWVSVMRVYDCVIGCLNQAIDGAIAACGAGQGGIVAVTGRDPRTGKRRVSVINPFCGGSGGRRTCDGIDGVDIPQASLQNTPVEMIELETPMRVRRYEWAADSFGPGQWRSGAAIVLELENTDAEAVMTVRGMNRFLMRPWGVNGGGPGSRGMVLLNPGTPAEKSIGKIDVLRMKKGDVVQMLSPAGGGFGDPRQRSFDLIESDVRACLLSEARAASDYDVVFSNGKIDRAQTTALRRDRQRNPALSLFAFGAEHDAYVQRWPVATRMTLSKKLFEIDPDLRSHVLDAVVTRVDAERAEGSVTAQQVESLVGEEVARLRA